MDTLAILVVLACPGITLHSPNTSKMMEATVVPSRQSAFPKANGTFQSSEAMLEALTNITGRAIEQAIELLRKANSIQDTGNNIERSHSVEKLKEMAVRVVEAATKHLQVVKKLSDTKLVMTPDNSTHSPNDEVTATKTPKPTESLEHDLPASQTFSQNGFLSVVEDSSDPRKIQKLLEALNLVKNMFSC